MKLQDLLAELSQKNVQLWDEGDQLGLRAPKGVLTTELRNSLVERKGEILAFLKQAKASRLGKLPLLSPTSRDKPLPLSFAQERLWLLEQLEPSSAVYNLSLALRLSGPLDGLAWEKSITEIVRRHEILRTRLEVVDKQPVQVIAAPTAFQLPEIDLSALPPDRQAAETELLIGEAAQQPFDLAGECLWRVKLLRLADTEWVFLLTMHHLISDGWSFRVFLSELSTLYLAFSSGHPTPLPELPIQYADFAHWQRQWVSGEGIAPQRNYWQQQLKGPISPRPLPAARPQGNVRSSRGARQSLVLPQALTDQLKALASKEGVTLFITLLAGFQALLFRYSGQEDLLVCSPVVGRNPAELEGLLGYFNNILPLRTNLGGDPSWRELLGRVRQVTTGAYEHQDLPFQQLAEFPHLVRMPLTKAMFNLEKAASDALELPGITVRPLTVDNGTANFDLSLSMEERGQTLVGVLAYKTDLFESETIARLLEDFQSGLESLVANPDLPLSSLPSLTKTGDEMDIPPAPAPAVGAAPPCLPPASLPPRDELERQLVEIWERFLDIHPIGITDNFFDLGGHSLLAIRLFAEIEKTCGHNLPLAILLQGATVEQLADSIRRAEGLPPAPSVQGNQPSLSDKTANRSLIPIQPQGHKPPMFFVHAAGGGLLYYRQFADYLGADQPFYGLEASGLDGQQVAQTTVEQMAADYIREMRDLQPEGPYCVGGLSFGGLVAFEIAQQLHRQGQGVALLALFDTIAPDAIQRLPLSQRVSGHWTRLFRAGPQYLWQKARGKVQWFRNRLREKSPQLLFGFYRLLGKPLPYQVRHDYVKQIHYQARIDYEPTVYPGVVTLFRAMQKNPGEGYIIDPNLGWSEFAGGGLEVIDVPGNHYSMMREPHVRVLGEKLKNCLEAVIKLEEKVIK